MKKMTSNEIRSMYLEYFHNHGHTIMPSASLLILNDPTLLWNNAGVTPLKKYFDGSVIPVNRRMTSSQKCIRTNDIESVGDNTHHTFFEMLGNFSIGDYFKEEAIEMAYELLVSPEYFGFPKDKLYFTVYTNDTDAYNKWVSMGVDESHIVKLDSNFWEIGEGPCGPDSEIFYDRGEEYDPNHLGIKLLTDEIDNSRYVEIWNNVFSQFNSKEGLKREDYPQLPSKNIDTGMGLERMTCIMQGVESSYDTDLFSKIINKIEELSNKKYANDREFRIIADHIRAIVIIAGDDAGIKPSNTDQGYILRRLIRRTIRYAKKLNIDINSDWEQQLAKLIINKYSKYYGELERNKADILETLKNEKIKFNRTLEHGLKEFEKVVKNIEGGTINKDIAFRLYDTFGFPIELTEELAGELGLKVDTEGFKQKFAEHQEKSRQGSTGKFKGGLASTGEMETKYHTATHLLNAALKKVLGPHVHQKGSNITAERMRFDFSHPAKMTDEEKKQTEDLVNEYIKMAIPVEKLEMKKEDALKMGAEAMFIDKYGDIVSVYKIGDVSLELCGGPHVKNTSELGHFKIKKEEASSAGVRRIKAILEK